MLYCFIIFSLNKIAGYIFRRIYTFIVRWSDVFIFLLTRVLSTLHNIFFPCLRRRLWISFARRSMYSCFNLVPPQREKWKGEEMVARFLFMKVPLKYADFFIWNIVKASAFPSIEQWVFRDSPSQMAQNLCTWTFKSIMYWSSPRYDSLYREESATQSQRAHIDRSVIAFPLLGVFSFSFPARLLYIHY